MYDAIKSPLVVVGLMGIGWRVGRDGLMDGLFEILCLCIFKEYLAGRTGKGGSKAVREGI